MGNTPLKLNGSGGDMREMTTGEENYAAYQAGLNLADDANTVVAALTTTSSGNTSIGSYSNTVFGQAVGTHPGSSISITTTTTTLYQVEGTAGESSGDFHRPCQWDNTLSGIQEMDDTDFNACVDRLRAVWAANEYPGTYRLGSSSPGAAYDTHLSNVFSDTRTDGTTVNYSIYQRQSMTAPTTVRSIKLRDGNGNLQEMTDAEMKETFGARMKTRIMAGSDGVGTYQLRSSAQGAPTATGTWVARGTATDTRNTTGDVDYSAAYTRISTRNSTQDFTSNYVGNSTVNYTNIFLRNITQDFTRLSTRTSQRNFTRLSTRNSQPDFTRLSTRNSTQNYTRDSAPTFTGDFTGNWTGDFTGDFLGNFTGDFIANIDYTRISTNVSTRYSNQFGQTGPSASFWAYSSGGTHWYGGNFTGDFTGNFIVNPNYTRISSRNSTNNFTRLSTRNSTVGYTGNYIGDFIGDFTGNWTGNYIGDYTGNWLGNFTGDYTGNWLGNFVGDYVGNWTGDFIGDFTGNWLGNYVGDFLGNFTGNYTGNYLGETILSGNQTIETYTLYQRTA